MGERRVQRRRQQAARHAEAQAKEATVRQRCAELDASVRASLPPSDPPFDPGFQVKLDTAIERFEERLNAQLRTSAERLRQRDGTLERFIADAESVADRAAIESEFAMQNVLGRLRERQLSRAQLAVLARIISARLGETELAIEEAREACDSTVRNVEQWTRSVAVAIEHDAPDLAEQASGRVEEWKSAENAANTALREYQRLQDQLRQVGQVLLECAEAR